MGWLDTEDPHGDLQITISRNSERRLAEQVASTLRHVFGLPHPAFLHDASAPERDPGLDIAEHPLPDHPDFQPTLVDCPDTATRAVGIALAQVYRHDVPADEHDVFAVPVGSALLLIRAHRSLPLIIFRSPLISHVADGEAAAAEVATLNRDSLWCRYVFDGETIYAESELVDRVFVPVNFKIRLAEISAELDDVDEDLAHRVGGKRWIDLAASDQDGIGPT